MTSVIPPLVALVSELTLNDINVLMRTFLERQNVVWIARSKPGLAFLTIFLSRAEILKQGITNAPARTNSSFEADITMWYVKIYIHMKIYYLFGFIYMFFL